MSSWVDVKLALRSLAHSPAYAAVALLMFTLGIGSAVFMFGAVNGYLIASLPFPESQRLVHVSMAEHASANDWESAPPRLVADWRREQRSFTDLAGFYFGTINLSGDDRPERYSGAFVTGPLFDVLGVPPALGRGLTEEDDRPGAPLSIVISGELWTHRFNEASDVIGTRVRVNGEDAEIVGVMPMGFRFPQREHVWVPQRVDLAALVFDGGVTMDVVGRLRVGVSATQANHELQSLYSAMVAEAPESTLPSQVSIRGLKDWYVDNGARHIILTLFFSVVLVLLIACTNVANLTLGRVAARRRELSVRATLGAGRARLVGGVMVELVVLASIGAAFGLMLGEWGGAVVDRLMADSQESPPYWVDMTADGRVVLFTVLAALGSAMVAGFIPAWRATGGDLNAGLRDGGYGSSDVRSGRMSRWLVVFQIALCCVLLIGAGLMLRSAANLNYADDGLGDRNAITGRIGLFETTHPDAAARWRSYEQLEQELAALPGVRSTAVASQLPLTGGGRIRYRPAGVEYVEQGDAPSTRWAAVTPGYFETFGVQLLQGRGFGAEDGQEAQSVAIVNAAFAAREWPDTDPVGQRIQLRYPDGVFVTVIGVVSDFVMSGDELYQGVEPAAFVPLAQDPVRFVSFAASVDGDPSNYANAVRAAMLRVDADTPIYWLRSFAEVTALVTFMSRLVATLLGIFAVIALLLAAAGVYSVLSTSVARSTREIGVRRALGASDETILRMIVGQGGRQYLVGISVGLMIAVGFAFVLASLLTGISPLDPVTFLSVPLMLGLVSLAAAWLPAKRALRIQPMEALRQE